MTSSNAQAWNKKKILLNNLESKQSGNEIWPVYVCTITKENSGVFVFSKNPL